MRMRVLSLLLVAAAFSVSVCLFIVIAHELFAEKEYALDNTVLHYVTTHIPSSSLAGGMVFISFFASGIFLAACYVCFFAFVVIKKKLMVGLYILSTGLSGVLVNTLLKLLFHRDRPTDPLVIPPGDFSFPSGHSSGAFIFYTQLIYLLWQSRLRRRTKQALSAFLAVFSFSIGFSRIYLRVHYATDVLAGFCVGAIWLSVSFFVYDQSHRGRSDKPQSNKRPSS